MDLDEYVWRNRITLKEVAEKTGINANTLSFIKNKKIIPRLDTAHRLYLYSEGEISYEEMIPETPREIIKNSVKIR